MKTARLRFGVLGLVLFSSLAFTLGLAGCGGNSDDTGAKQIVVNNDPTWFTEITDQVGLKFDHDAGVQDKTYFMPQICGAGVVVLDFNKDGRMDIYLIHSGGPKSKSTNRLFQQMHDGTFKDVSEGSGLDIAGYNLGAAVGDINNDGWPDVLVTQYPAAPGQSSVHLFINQGNGKFKDVTHEAGLFNSLWASSAAFFDFDRDGWLDLFVVNYVSFDQGRLCTEVGGTKNDYCGPKNFEGTASRLYRNLGTKAAEEGKAVLLQDFSTEAGVAGKRARGLGIVTGDFNGDGWLDVLVANDGQANFLWINHPADPKEPNGRQRILKEEGLQRGVAHDTLGQSLANMGVAWGDVDGDGLFDLFITHLPNENNTLWVQDRKNPGFFKDKTVASGLANPNVRCTGWGTCFMDFDNDGDLDIAIVNGRVSARELFNGDNWADFHRNYWDPNQLFENDGTGKFRDISLGNKEFCDREGVYRALIWADFDNDGAMDLIWTEIHRPARIFKNIAPKKGNWLMIRALELEPKRGGRDAYGAMITVKAGDRKWLRDVNPCQSYLTTADPRVHFGVGPATKVDAIEVTWVDGEREAFPGGDVNRHITLRRGEGKSLAKK
jgi:hypothetical protein